MWKAIYHHYLPIGVEADAPPTRAQLGAAAVTWAAVSLADKLDTVVGLSTAGETATGSRDPFGLRRQMHGIVRILMDLPELAGDRSRDSAPRCSRTGRRRGSAGGRGAATAEAVVAFAQERVRFVLEQRGLPIEVVRGATASAGRRPLRARRRGRSAAGAAPSGGFPGARGAVQARQEHRARSRRRRRRSIVRR